MPGKMARRYNKQQSFFNKTTFFPLLCNGSSLSIKDVKLTTHSSTDFSSSSSSSSSATNGGVSSPKVSCIGQIRRNNKIFGFSSTPPPRLTSSSAPATAITNTTKTAAVVTHGQGKYMMFRRSWFSGRNVGVNVASSCTDVVATGCGGGGSSGGSGSAIIRCSKENHYTDENVRVDVDNLEPPIPVVIKNVSQPPEVNLWKRRCGGGVALKILEPISR